MVEANFDKSIVINVEVDELSKFPQIDEVINFFENLEVKCAGCPSIATTDKANGKKQIIIKVEFDSNEDTLDAIAKLDG